MYKNTASSTHPTLPPTTDDAIIDCLRLLRSRKVGPVTYRRLMAEHGSATAALDALPQVARAAGIDSYTPCPTQVAVAEIRAGRHAKARLVFQGEAAYPASLNNLTDAPVAIWMVGQVGLMKRPMVSLIGARTASSLGTRMAQKLARELGEAGFTVVSGLARGIDTAAHIGALASGTLAVLAGGVDVLYPAQNTELGQKIGVKGLRLSDQPMGLQPQARHFIARNRLISGLATATVVVEAAAKSGSLSCAQGALDQGRDVLVVPGHPYEARYAGCNMLIRDGATLVRGTQDVVDHLEKLHPCEDATNQPPETPVSLNIPPPSPQRGLSETAKLHEMILDRLNDAPMGEDQLMRALNVAPTAVAPVLVDLELEGQVIRQAGGILARCN